CSRRSWASLPCRRRRWRSCGRTWTSSPRPWSAARSTQNSSRWRPRGRTSSSSRPP
ncbi:unnamed protein product, partial [Prorocentrum cordatum]